MAHTQQHSHHVPKFGNWENADNVPYTAYFENARKEKGGGVMINPNDPMENLEAFNMCTGGNQNVDADLEVKASQNKSHQKSSLEKGNHTGRHVHKSKGSQGSVTSGISSSSHKSRGSSLDDSHMNHQATAVPKFGSWDVNDPKSGEGYSDIFSKIKEEKHTAPSHIASISTPSPNCCSNSKQNGRSLIMLSKDAACHLKKGSSVVLISSVVAINPPPKMVMEPDPLYHGDGLDSIQAIQ